MSLDVALKRHLLRLARRSIASAIGLERTGESDRAEPHAGDDVVDVRAAAFVTLRLGGQLRGCIGSLDAGRPVSEVVERCAVSAALSDPRFPPLSASEWPDLDVEISVLGPLTAVGDISDVMIGAHGLVVELGDRGGLLLPQVAAEHGWTPTEFASQTCLKAGMAPDAWKNGAKLFRFEAEVFGP